MTVHCAAALDRFRRPRSLIVPRLVSSRPWMCAVAFGLDHVAAGDDRHVGARQDGSRSPPIASIRALTTSCGAPLISTMPIWSRGRHAGQQQGAAGRDVELGAGVGALGAVHVLWLMKRTLNWRAAVPVLVTQTFVW